MFLDVKLLLRYGVAARNDPILNNSSLGRRAAATFITANYYRVANFAQKDCYYGYSNRNGLVAISGVH